LGHGVRIPIPGPGRNPLHYFLTAVPGSAKVINKSGTDPVSFLLGLYSGPFFFRAFLLWEKAKQENPFHYFLTTPSFVSKVRSMGKACRRLRRAVERGDRLGAPSDRRVKKGESPARERRLRLAWEPPRVVQEEDNLSAGDAGSRRTR